MLDAEDIESDMSKFTDAKGSVALVLANRFDGIDLPGDTCRRLVVVGVPGALNLQETFLRERLGAHAVLRNRVRVRFTQALGRCTRNPSDFALVYCVGRDLLKWCSTRTNSEGLSPELQAELEFGLRQSENLSKADACDYLDAFFGQTEEWRDADASIRADAKEMPRTPSDSSGALAAAVEYEIRYVQDLWRDDPVQAHENAAKVSDMLNKPGLKPYRAFWEYLAATAADAAHRVSGDDKFHRTFLSHVQMAARLAGGVRWLAALSFAHPSIMPNGSPFGVSVIEALLEEWQIRGSKFERSVSEARADLNNNEAGPFQRGLAVLGRMLGFQTKRHNGTGAPDGVWWTEDGHFYDFEAKSKEKPEAPISFDTVRQAMVHPEWLSQNDKELPPVRETTIVVVSPRSKIQDKAAGIAKDARYMSLVDARTLFDEAASVLNEIRARAIGLDEESLQEVITETYHKKGLMGDALRERIAGTRLRSLPVVATA